MRWKSDLLSEALLRAAIKGWITSWQRLLSEDIWATQAHKHVSNDLLSTLCLMWRRCTRVTEVSASLSHTESRSDVGKKPRDGSLNGTWRCSEGISRIIKESSNHLACWLFPPGLIWPCHNLQRDKCVQIYSCEGINYPSAFYCCSRSVSEWNKIPVIHWVLLYQ